MFSIRWGRAIAPICSISSAILLDSLDNFETYLVYVSQMMRLP